MGKRTELEQTSIWTAWSATAIIVAGLLLRLAIAPSYGYAGYDGDLHEQKQAAHRAITCGIYETYIDHWENDPALSGKPWDGSYYADYPPVVYYLRAVTGYFYALAEPQAFQLWDSQYNFFTLLATDLEQRLAETRGFTVMMKLPCILADVAISILLFVFVSRRWTPNLGLAATAIYALNPGVVFNTAFWGQHDAIWALFVFGSLWLLHRGRPELSWVLLTLALLTKQQALPFVPLLLMVTVWHFGIRRLVTSVLASAGAFVVVWLPYILHGTFWTSFSSIVVSTFVGEPYLSLNAANLWWLLSGARGDVIPSATTVLGFLEARDLALLAFVGCYVAILARLGSERSRRADLLFLAAGTVAMTFFTLATNLHENHMYVVIPLACFVLGLHRTVPALIGVLSVTFLANLALFDSAIVVPLAGWLGRPLPVEALSLAVAAVNVAACGVWLWLFWNQTAKRVAPGPGGPVPL